MINSPAHPIYFLEKVDHVVMLTPRLEIRSLTPDDSKLMRQFALKNREFLKPFEPSRDESYFTQEFWEANLRDSLNQFKEEKAFRFLFIDRNQGGSVLGSVNFSNLCRGPFQAANLGYSLDQTVQGQGLMNEALSALLHFMFEKCNFHRIMANYLVSNQRSGRLLAKLGFEVEGKAKFYLKINGEWQDHILTSKINNNWKSV